MLIYKEYYQRYTSKAGRLKKTINWLSFSRLALFVLFLFLAYRSTQTGSGITISFTVVFLALFFVVVKWYDRLEQELIFYKTLSKVNEDEARFVETNRSQYDEGREYENVQHPYSYDLDIFSTGGLFSYLNRCSTEFGKEALKSSLLQPDISAIKPRQEAVKELSDKVEFRQKLFAHGSIHEGKKADLEKLKEWIDSKETLIHKTLYLLLMVFPVVTIGSLVYYLIKDSDAAFRIFYSLFVINLIIAFSFAKRITKQLSVSSSVTKILQSYKAQLLLIEEENFQSDLLKQYQQKLKDGNQSASQLLKQLASLFDYLETIINLLVSILLNGLFLFHIHILYRLGNWKKKHANKINDWLLLIGEVEALNSFANFSYNNSSFCFPEVNDRPAFEAKELGHILIKPGKRITNDVSFNQQKFVILTGSNMSGKSTFLRTVGTNLVLAKAGSVVCAAQMQFYPFDIFVSMRITDSLQESESLFYAELKRLQSIIQHLQAGNITFVILDEILRGTNSNDKRNGTIGLIRKMAKENTFGIIATHDVVVADLIKEYSDYIANKAFESQIINDELLFDYKLKEGVCNTLSASYLMKKMGVIDSDGKS